MKYKIRKLAPEALYSSEMYEEHRLRANRDRGNYPRPDHDVETPEDCWERVTAERIQRIDPGGQRARALLREFMHKSPS